MSAFGQALREVMKERGVTGHQLARDFGCNPSHINDTLTGRKAPTRAFAEGLGALGLFTDELRVQYHLARRGHDLWALTDEQIGRLM